MSDGDETYRCPVCAKPFDTADKLFDFAIAAHAKDHTPQRNNAANLIRFEEDGLMWVCKLCGDPLHIGEFSARQQAVTHCRVKHGSLPHSSAPVTARGGRSGSGGKVRDSAKDGFLDGVGDVVGDALGGIGRAVGKVLGGIFD